MIVLLDAEDRTIVSSFLWTKHQNVTDRRTDSQPVLLQRSAVRAIRTRCINLKVIESILQRCVCNVYATDLADVRMQVVRRYRCCFHRRSFHCFLASYRCHELIDNINLTSPREPACFQSVAPITVFIQIRLSCVRAASLLQLEHKSNSRMDCVRQIYLMRLSGS